MKVRISTGVFYEPIGDLWPGEEHEVDDAFGLSLIIHHRAVLAAGELLPESKPLTSKNVLDVMKPEAKGSKPKAKHG